MSKTNSIKRRIVFGMFIFVIICHPSCEKEYSCEGCSGDNHPSIAGDNHPPIANAGKDTIIIFPVDSVILDGSASNDPDNNIASYTWTKISGPASFNIANDNGSQTNVTDLTEGFYLFELKVTDVEGLYTKDTTQVTVQTVVNTGCDISNRPLVNAQLIPFGSLSVPRMLVTIATAGTKILFAGGMYDDGGMYFTTDLVDIYDTVTQVWSTAHLSSPRYSVAAVTDGNKIYFAGGRSNTSYNNGLNQFSILDIYDAAANTWSTTTLTGSRTALSVAKIGDKILFAGGRNEIPPLACTAIVDILNTSSNTWSTVSLSQGRSDMAVATIGDKVYFGGGNTEVGPINGTHNPSTTIDIYDNATNSWSVSHLSEPRANFAGIAFGNKIIWVGGENYLGDGTSTILSSVEITDLGIPRSSITCLFEPNSWFDVAENNNRLVFFTGGGPWSYGGSIHSRFDIFNKASESWSIGVLDREISHSAILTINGTTYVAGGLLNNSTLSDQVWKLEF